MKFFSRVYLLVAAIAFMLTTGIIMEKPLYAAAKKVVIIMNNGKAHSYQLDDVQRIEFREEQGASQIEPMGARQSGKALLTQGWDIFNEPLAIGMVDWSVLDNGTFQVSYEMRGASPNHKYIVGLHFFDPGKAGILSDVCEFGGRLKVGCGRSNISREGVTATVIGGSDFGYLTTDGSGYGKALFSINPPAGTYYIQFTVRIGDVCNPATGQTGGCAAVYRTGEKMGKGLEIINIP